MSDQAMVSKGSSVGSGGDGGSDGDGGKTLGGKVLSLGSLDSGLIDGHDSSVGMGNETSKGGGVRVGSASVHAVVVGVGVSSTLGGKVGGLSGGDRGGLGRGDSAIRVSHQRHRGRSR